MYGGVTKLVLKYKLTIILLLVFWFILSCHCMKPLNVLNFMKKKEEKKSVKEGMSLFGGLDTDKEFDKNAKDMCGFGGNDRVRDAGSYRKDEESDSYVARKDGAGDSAGRILGIVGWNGTREGETHVECRGRAKRELREAGSSASFPVITKYGDMIVSFGGGMLGFLILAAIVGTILALKNSTKSTLLFDDLIEKKKLKKENCDARSKEGKCVDEIVGTTPSRSHLRMRLETKENQDYEIRKSESEQKGLKDAVKLISKGGSKLKRNKHSRKKGGSRRK